MNEKDIFICECNSHEHQIIVTYDEELNYVFLTIHLTKRGFFNRLWLGIKYILGYKSKYGNWDQFMLNPDDRDKIEKINNFLKQQI